MLFIIIELIITSGGENIPPVLLEDNILREVPFLSNVMVVGDKRKYLTCLMTLKVCSDKYSVLLEFCFVGNNTMLFFFDAYEKG